MWNVKELWEVPNAEDVWVLIKILSFQLSLRESFVYHPLFPYRSDSVVLNGLIIRLPQEKASPPP